VQLVSADVPPGHVAAGRQNWTLVSGALAEGPNVGTVSNAVPDGEALGEVFGEVFAEVVALGECVPPTLFEDPPLVAAKMPPPTPIRRIRMIAAIAGTSHGGRSVAWSRTGRRGAGGFRAGAEGAGAGVEIGGRVVVAGDGAGATYAGAAGVGSGGAWTSSFGAWAISPLGVQAGVGMEVQVGFDSAGAGSAAFSGTAGAVGAAGASAAGLGGSGAGSQVSAGSGSAGLGGAGGGSGG